MGKLLVDVEWFVDRAIAWKNDIASEATRASTTTDARARDDACVARASFALRGDEAIDKESIDGDDVGVDRVQCEFTRESLEKFDDALRAMKEKMEALRRRDG